MKSSKGLRFRVINNVLAFFCGRTAVRLLKFVTSLWIIRNLSREEFGQFCFIYVFLYFFEVFVEFGANSIMTREITQNRERAPQILGNALIFRGMLCLVTVPATWLLVRLLNYPFSIQQGVFLASFQLIFTLRAVFEIIYRVELKILYAEMWNVGKALLTLLFVSIAVFFKPSLYAFIYAHLLSSFLGFVGFALYTRRFVRIDFRPDFLLIRQLIKESFPMLLSGYLTILYYRLDVFMLSKMKTFSDVGYYSVAVRVSESLGVVASSLFVSLFPMLSESYYADHERFNSLILKGFKVLLLAGLPIAVGGSFVAPELITALFGKEYAPSAPTLSILLWYTFLFFQGGFLANILIAGGKQVANAWFSFLLVLVNMGLNWIWIPAYSYNGAALATVVAAITGVVLITVYAALEREIKMPLPWKELGLAGFLNLLFCGALFLLKSVFNSHVFVTIAVGVLIYGVLLMAFRVLSWAQILAYFKPFKKEKAGSVESKLSGS